MPRLSASSLDGLRSVIRPEYAGLPAENLERVLQDSISGLPAATAEDFMSTLSSFGKVAGPALQRAAPSVAQGAATGATFGPWGAVIGAGAGLAGSLLTKDQPAPPPAPPAPPAPSAAPSPSPAPSPTPSAPAPAGSVPAPAAAKTPMPAATSLPTGQGAAATLFSLLQNRQVQDAFLSQALGSLGSQQVSTASGTSLPRGAINSLLTQLLANASDALPEFESISEQSYLQDASGEYLVDPASHEQQAALVLSHIRRTRSEKLRSDVDDFMEGVEWETEAAPETESEGWHDVDVSSEAVTFY